MSDLFISYSSENRVQIVPLVNALEEQGWKVWWDRKIPVGKRYDEVILQALEESKCVIVAWTNDSVSSDFVRDEASRANEQDKLFPVRLEDVDPPLGFGVIQTADLTNWDGKHTHREFTRLIQAIGEKCPSTPTTDPIQEESPPDPLPLFQKRWPILPGIKRVLPSLLLVGGPFVLGTISFFISLNSAAVIFQATVSEFSFVSTTQQEFSDPLAIADLKAAGLTQIGVPSASEFPHETLSIKEGMLGTIVVTSGGQGEDKGDITLDTITLSSGNSIRVVKNSSPFQYKLTLAQSDQQIRVNLKGSVDIMVPGIGMTHRVFSFPKTLLLQAGKDGLDVEIKVADPPNNLLPSPLFGKNIGLFRVEERRGDESTAVRRVSTILNGKFYLNGKSHQLASEEYLQFEHSEGSLKTIRLNQDNLEVEFHGQVQGMKSCQETKCTSLMPTYWEWSILNYSTVIMVGGIIYLSLVLQGGMRLWKR